MGLIQEVQNGAIVKPDSSSSATSSSSTAYDKDMFLQLLVAEMQYQDPLEPTSNTEYVTELASFTQIEATQAATEQINQLYANSLVGQYVVLMDENGNETSGLVDYVLEQDGTYYLSVNDNLYDISTLKTVANAEYYEANVLANSIVSMIEALPNASSVTLADAEKITAVRQMYDALNSYQKQFVPEKSYTTFEEIENRLNALLKAKADAEASQEA